MRARDAALVVVLLAAGCLVPAYEVEPPLAAGGGGSGGAVSGSPGKSGSSGSSGTEAGGADGEDCTATQKSCAGQCVEVDDPTYGCGETSCDAAACPLAGDGELACESGACVVGSCGAGQKKCDGKCVAVSDPTYGCGETSCDASACPAAGAGTIVCNAGVCEKGACSEETKECDGKCVPRDRNNGCDAVSCSPCGANDDCLGNPSVDSPTICTCVSEDACAGRECGTAKDRCGRDVTCMPGCPGGVDKVCDNGQCVECLVESDCDSVPGNPCIAHRCNDKQCNPTSAPEGTPCSSGTCSEFAVCEWSGPVNAGGVSIDPTEVTLHQYSKFLVATGGTPPAGQPSYCSWNTTVEPQGPTGNVIDSNKPIVWVDWCDAYAYCKWAGRRLCGKIGGGPSPLASHGDPAVSQWMHACSGSPKYNYPYGTNNYYSQMCHDTRTYLDKTYLNDTTASAGTIETCEGGYDGLWDMSGNVHEWEDSCAASSGANDMCRQRGGSFWESDFGGDQLRCDANRTAARNSANAYTGFRCCGP